MHNAFDRHTCKITQGDPKYVCVCVSVCVRISVVRLQNWLRSAIASARHRTHTQTHRYVNACGGLRSSGVVFMLQQL